MYHCTTTRFTPLRHDRPPGSALSGRAPLQAMKGSSGPDSGFTEPGRVLLEGVNRVVVQWYRYRPFPQALVRYVFKTPEPSVML